MRQDPEHRAPRSGWRPRTASSPGIDGPHAEARWIEWLPAVSGLVISDVRLRPARHIAQADEWNTRRVDTDLDVGPKAPIFGPETMGR